MLFLNRKDYPEYVLEALTQFHEIVSNHKNGSFEDLNRINKGESFVLRYLVKKQNKVYPSEIGNALGSSNARVSALLNRLEEKNLIKREIDEDNRRNILVSITDEGKNRIKDEITEIQTIAAKIFLEMGESDTIEFLRLFKIFSDSVKKSMFPNL